MEPSSILEYMGVVVKWPLRSRLALSADGRRCQEQIVWPPRRLFQQSSGIFLRLLVRNIGTHTAHNTLVYVTRIERDAIVIDADPSPLAWTDVDQADWFSPRDIASHKTHQFYVDICATDSADSTLSVISQKWTRGYHRFGDSGTYAIDVVAKCPGISSEAKAVIEVQFDNTKLDSLRYSSIKSVSKNWIGIKTTQYSTP